MDLNSNPQLENNAWYVGKIIAQKIVKLSTIHSVLKLVWARYGQVNISEANTGILLFNYDRDEDVHKILDLSPWVINGHILNIKRWDPSIGVKDVEFNKVMFKYMI